MGETSIEWCDYTQNPWRGCAKVHAGCTHCYAEGRGKRFDGDPWGEVWVGGRRIITSDATFFAARKWAAAAAKAGVRKKVFCASLCDVLEVIAPPAQWPREWTAEQRGFAEAHVRTTREAVEKRRAQLWQLIRDTAQICPHCGEAEEVCEHLDAEGPEIACGLDYLLLTKHPENWELIPEDVRPLAGLGTSISDQATADEWVPRLLAARGFRLRFLSIEPLVGPVDLRRWTERHATTSEGDCPGWCPRCQRMDHHGAPRDAEIHWVIVGGESGPGARPCAVKWIRSIVQQCAAARVPCFVKQLGALAISDVVAEDGASFQLPLRDRKGGYLPEWPTDDLRVRQFPEVACG